MLEDVKTIIAGNRFHQSIKSPPQSNRIILDIHIKMPMPGKTPEEQAKQGALQYAKAWGGMSMS
jgi:hypothetical protein